MQDPPASQSLPRLGCLLGTLSPSRRQIRSTRLSLIAQLNLPKLGNNLFSFVTLPCHRGPPGCQRHTSSRTTSVGVDHRHARSERSEDVVGGVGGVRVACSG